MIPHRALNDIHLMNDYLKEKLKSAKEMTDLIPFMNTLMSLEDIKKHLLILLNKQYIQQCQKEKEEKQQNNLRSLFLSLFSLNGVPSDMVHAKILSYLPSKEYKKMPILCTHFRNIMKQYPSIYNEKHYEIILYFHDSKRNRKDSAMLVSVSHENCKIKIEPKFDGKCYLNLNNISFPWNYITCWKLKDEWCSSYTITDENEDNFNNLAHKALIKQNNFIRRLHITTSNDEMLKKVFETNENTFSNCQILSLSKASIKSVCKNSNSFSNVQCLELLDVRYEETKHYQYKRSDIANRQKKLYQRINHILNLLSQCLRSFVFHSFHTRTTEDDSDDVILQIPCNMEWISFMNVDCIIDFSKCNKLIAVANQTNFGDAQKTIIWPQDHIIPYARICEKKDEKWKKVYLSDNESSKPPIKFLSILSVSKSFKSTTKTHYKDEHLKRYTIEDVMDKEELYSHSKCLVLDWTEYDGIFEKIMCYAFRDESIRNNKISQYQKWWGLETSLWIKNWDHHEFVINKNVDERRGRYRGGFW